MLGKLKRKLFPQKYLLREMAERMERIEKVAGRNQWAIESLVSKQGTGSSDLKDLTYFFHLKRAEARGQLLQDLWVVWETKGKFGGYFVEFGAASGYDLSNTCLLEEKYGWKGILAEPMPGWLPQLKKRSAIIETRCVWKASGERLSFVCNDTPELSGLSDLPAHDKPSGGKTIEVETISLNDLLDEHHAPKVIDYLSMDTEGSEYEILKAFDFSQYRFNLITVEHNSGPLREPIHRLLSEKGYTRVFTEISQFDDWYVHGSFRSVQA